MKQHHRSQRKEDPRRINEQVRLDRRYEDIGISAVAAALQHHGEKRDPPVRKSTALAKRRRDSNKTNKSN